MSTAEGAKGIIRNGLIAYWDAANYLSNPTASGGLSTAVTLPTDYEWIDMIEGNRLYVSGGTGTLATATTAANYNLGGIFKSLQNNTVTLTNRAITGSLNTNLSALTFEVWMRITDSAGLTGFVFNNDFGFNKGSALPSTSWLNFFVFNTAGGSISANASASYGTYPSNGLNTPPVHVVGTYDGQTARIYTNGTLSSNSSSFASPNTLVKNTPTANQWQFWTLGGSSFSQGYFYIVRVYNRALSDQEVQQNYLSQAGRFLSYNINP